MSVDMQAEIKALQDKVEKLQQQLNSEVESSKHATIMVSDNSYEKLLIAFGLATNAASLGIKVTMFFSFWGVTALKKENVYKNKSWMAKMMTFMMPSNAEGSKLSKFQFFGLGKWMMLKMMKQNHMSPVSQLIKTAQTLDIRIVACTPTMQLMGIKKEELIDGVECAGATPFIVESSKSKISWLL